MKVTPISKKDNKLSFLVEGVSPAFMNSIRRVVMSEVPVMAIDTVEFRANDSVLYDEIVAHRLGLVPIKTDLKSYNIPSKCTCENAGCAKCQLKMTINVEGPKMVLASHIKSQDPKVVPVYDEMPITKLLENQSLKVEAIACLGIGKDHAKWSPGICFYKHEPIIEIDNKKIEDAKLIAQSCPLSVFDVKGKDLVVNEKKKDSCHMCEACVNASKGAVIVKPNTESFMVSIESWGQLPPKKIVSKACEVFIEKLDDFDNLVDQAFEE